ncbi:DUF4352 domain-containing protein [Actinoplanes sp. NPDC051513]|uniref:DUF4352 domain-containing protein n=1 Tax=Actinoplanes sp. NPDC051513 TaxID=3363908 RepID=UPI0037AACEA0
MPPKKRSPLLWVLAAVGVVVVLCLGIGVIGAIAGGGNDSADIGAPAATDETGEAAPTTKAATKPAATKPATKAPAKKAPGIGDKVRDGKFEFTVTGMDCSKTKVGDQYLNTAAQGKFCVVAVNVKNIGDEPQTFTGGNQKAYAGKTEFNNDSEAELYINSDAATFLEEINPGNSVKGKLVFDVPKSTKLTEVELHDGFFSGGVRVAL